MSSTRSLTPGPPPLSTPRAVWLMLHPVPSLMTVLVAGAFIVLAFRGVPPWERFLPLLLVETGMQFSISAFNDYFDRAIDAGRADKPVAAGRISSQVAWVLGASFGAVALLPAASFGGLFFLFTAVGLAGGLLYDAGLKYTALSWLPFSLAFPTLPLWAWAGALPGGTFPQQLYWVVPVGGVLVLGIHLADTIPDLAGDTVAGVRGLAHRLGLRRSLLLCWWAFGAGALLTIALLPFVHYQLQWYLPGLAIGLLLMCVGVGLYLRSPGRVRQMSLLLEMGAMSLAVGWVAAITQ